MTRSVFALLLLGAALLGGCATEKWMFATVRGVDRQLVWQASLDVLWEKGHYEVDIADAQQGEATMAWREELGIFHNKGERRRAYLKVEPASTDEDAFIVGMRIEREINSAWHDTLESQLADWDSADDDIEEAQTLMMHLRVVLQATRGTESEEFKRRYERKQVQ